MQIPTIIGTLPSHTTIVLSQNQFTRPIPSSMRNLSKLELLRHDDNMLRGEIPAWFFSITTPEILHIGNNRLFWNNEAKIVPRYVASKHRQSQKANVSTFIPMSLDCLEDMSSLKGIDNEEDGEESWFLWEGTWRSTGKTNGVFPGKSHRQGDEEVELQNSGSFKMLRPSYMKKKNGTIGDGGGDGVNLSFPVFVTETSPETVFDKCSFGCADVLTKWLDYDNG
ncbi:hypothetical protein QVD17_11252 [Tagetes erecta]|uniref:Uncharacterized protein n=1 Tax=Tagetes erecta TaxID=13708 RepID=A0AAD8KWY8_TARER|nr:hypothetical protein QVD17_11252 [Tagetes erecta]